MGSAPRRGFARLAQNGTLDAAFDPVLDAGSTSVLVQDDGRFLVAGSFTTAGGITRSYLARFEADGTIDHTFNVQLDGHPFGFAMQPDGKILIAGSFTHVAETPRSGIARLHPDGSLDTSFDAKVLGHVRAVAIQPDGKILIGGPISRIDGVIRNSLARVLQDGALDSSFDPAPNRDTKAICVLPDGKILVSGNFNYIAGVNRPWLARLYPDGSLDDQFSSPIAGSAFLSLQADGKILAAYGIPKDPLTFLPKFERYHANGALDPTFACSTDDLVTCASLQGDGRILVSGFFLNIGGTACAYLARLDNDPAVDQLAVSSQHMVEWTRGGSAPEAQFVTFDLSTDGGATWAPLGQGMRTPSGWMRDGLDLPSNGQIRARARTISNLSSGIVQSTATFSFGAVRTMEHWRQENFAERVVDSSVASDLADPDGDGLSNVVEYAVGGNPWTGNLPFATPTIAGGSLTLSFVRDERLSDLTYEVEGTVSPEDPWSWRTIASATPVSAWQVTSGVTIEQTEPGPIRTVTIREPLAPGAIRRFLRLKFRR